MRRGFINGMMLGSAVGFAVSAFMKGQNRAASTRHLWGSTRRLGKRTGRMVTDMARDVQDFIQR